MGFEVVVDADVGVDGVGCTLGTVRMTERDDDDVVVAGAVVVVASAVGSRPVVLAAPISLGVVNTSAGAVGADALGDPLNANTATTASTTATIATTIQRRDLGSGTRVMTSRGGGRFSRRWVGALRGSASDSDSTRIVFVSIVL